MPRYPATKYFACRENFGDTQPQVTLFHQGHVDHGDAHEDSIMCQNLTTIPDLGYEKMI